MTIVCVSKWDDLRLYNVRTVATSISLFLCFFYVCAKTELNVVRCVLCVLSHTLRSWTINLEVERSTRTRRHTVTLSFPSSSCVCVRALLHWINPCIRSNKSPICRFVFRQNIVNLVANLVYTSSHTHSHSLTHSQAHVRALHWSHRWSSSWIRFKYLKTHLHSTFNSIMKLSSILLSRSSVSRAWRVSTFKCVCVHQHTKIWQKFL